MGDYQLIRYQILQTYIMRTVSPTVKRITNEILGVKELSVQSRSDARVHNSLSKIEILTI